MKNKKHFFGSFLLVVGSVFFGVSSVFAASCWEAPIQLPPNGNVPAPIHIGPFAQEKEGDLSIKGDFLVGENGALRKVCLEDGTNCLGGFGGATEVTAAGRVSNNTITITEDWDIIYLNGQALISNGDASGSGGYVFKDGGDIYARLFSGQGADWGGQVTTSWNCVNAGGSYQLCVQLITGGIQLKAGSEIKTQYIAVKFGGGGVGGSDSDWVFSGSSIYSGNSGNVGIGTSNPTYKLHVTGEVYSSGGSFGVYGSGSSYGLFGQDSDTSIWSYIGYGNYGVYSNGPLRGSQLCIEGDCRSSWPSGSGGPDNDWTINGNNLYSTQTGNVGIGTTNPTSKLYVVGDIVATGTICGVDGCAGSGSSSSGDSDWSINGNDVYKTSGRVGIGVSNPQYNLHTTGEIYSNGGSFGVYGRGSSYGVYGRDDDSGSYAYVGYGSYGIYSNARVRGNQLCIGGDCRSSWPGIGGTQGTGIQMTGMTLFNELGVRGYPYGVCPSGYVAHTCTCTNRNDSVRAVGTITPNHRECECRDDIAWKRIITGTCMKVAQ